MPVYYQLSNFDICVAALLILINGFASLLLKLQLEWRLLVAALRTIGQLLLIGFVLEWIFRQDRWLVIAILMILMSAIAGIAAVRRTDRRFPGIWFNSLGAVMVSSWLVTLIALTAIFPPSAWSQNTAQYAIPLLGMILGNTLNGISLGLDRLSDHLVSNRSQVELMLSLGATRWEAARDSLRSAIRTGMIPIINSMMVVGVVSLPGMMTGQLLAGAAPLDAVRYQIVIMFLIAAGTALGTLGVVLLSYRCLFNARHQFLYERITKAG